MKFTWAAHLAAAFSLSAPSVEHLPEMMDICVPSLNIKKIGTASNSKANTLSNICAEQFYFGLV